MMAYLDGYSGYSGVPEDAAAEILEKLMTHQQISSDEVAQILKRYGVSATHTAGVRCSPPATLMFWWIAAMTATRWNTSTRSWIRTWKQLIRRHVRLTIVCRCCSCFHGIGGSADEII